MFTDFREGRREEGGERERERPDQGSNLQPRYAPWPGIVPATFLVQGIIRCSNQGSHPARAICAFSYRVFHLKGRPGYIYILHSSWLLDFTEFTGAWLGDQATKQTSRNELFPAQALKTSPQTRSPLSLLHRFLCLHRSASSEMNKKKEKLKLAVRMTVALFICKDFVLGFNNTYIKHC